MPGGLAGAPAVSEGPAGSVTETAQEVFDGPG